MINKKSLNKKTKRIILSGIGVASSLLIVPIVTVACSSSLETNTTKNTTPTTSNTKSPLTQLSTNLSNLNIKANYDNNSVYNVYDFLSAEKILSLKSFDFYFSTKLIENSLATLKDLNPVTYTIEPISMSNFTQGTININVLLSTGTGTNIEKATANITVTGFETSQNLLNNINDLNFTILISMPSNGVYDTDAFSNLFSVNELQNKNNYLPGIPKSIIKNFTISNSNYIFGDLSFVISLNNGQTSKPIIISNYTSQLSNFLDEIKLSTNGLYVAPTITKPISLSNNVLENLSKLGITLLGGNDIYQYITNYQYIDKTDKNPSQITFTITNPLTSKTTSKTYTIAGDFKTASSTNPLNNLVGNINSTSIYANYWSSSNPPTTLSNSDTNNSLFINNNGTSPFISNAVLAQSGKTLPTFITNINWPNNYNESNVTSWTMIGNNNTGIATYDLTFSNGTKGQLVVNGFMTEKVAQELAVITAITSTNAAQIIAPNDNSFVSIAMQNQMLGYLGISSLGFPDNISSLQGGISSYSITNSNQLLGTANLLIHFNNGTILSVPLSGYTTNSLKDLKISLLPNMIDSAGPSNGEISLKDAQTFFKFSNLDSSIDLINNIKSLYVNSSGSGSLYLEVTLNDGTTAIYAFTQLYNLIQGINNIAANLTFSNPNSDGSLIPIETAFPQNKPLLLKVSEINSWPNWINKSSITTDIETLNKANISSANIYISIYLSVNLNSPQNLSTNVPSSISAPVTTVFLAYNYGTSGNGLQSNPVPASQSFGNIFQPFNQYLQNGLVNLTLNKTYLNKISRNDFIALLRKDNIIGELYDNGTSQGGLIWNNYITSENYKTTAPFTKSTWDLIQSLFDINFKPSLFNYNDNNTSAATSVIAVVANPNATGINIRIYLGADIYLDFQIPNSDFIVAS